MAKVKKSKKDKDRKHKMTCGRCFFCLNKCSKCGSKDVEGTARIDFTWDSDFSDGSYIRFSSGNNLVEIYCRTCGNEEYSYEFGDLVASMCELPSGITIHDKSVCTVHFMTVTPVSEA